MTRALYPPGRATLAGEGVATDLMKLAVRLLTRHARFVVADQDLCIQMSRMPALPRDRFLVADIRAV